MRIFSRHLHPRRSTPAADALLASLLVLVPLFGAATARAAGTPACGIFVSTAQGADDGTCGLDPSSPCATIGHGIARAQAESQTCLFVQAGSYNEVVTLPAAELHIYGGYDLDWSYASRTQSGHLVTITGGFDGGTGRYLTVRAVPGATASIDNLEIHGAHATGSIGGVARSSYAVHAKQAALDLTGVRIIGGNGAAGSPGSNGTSASQAPAAGGSAGGNAAQYATVCDNTSRGAGGSPGINAVGSRNGGAGGPGGTMDTNCTLFSENYNATPGAPGFNAASYVGGGSGYRGNGGSPCAPGGNGNAGSSTNGPGGIAASPGGTLVGDYWASHDGTSGALGGDGTGGGGGGGSGGCDSGTDSYGAGGGGGGAGGARAPVAGIGGHGGGSSFGVFAIASTLTLTDVEFQRGSGAAGGSGGAGGAGQPGGSGGPGGQGAGGSPPGGSGGTGGRGGASGGGSGGAGGSAYGVYACDGAYTPVNVSFAGGAPGSGGSGGAPAAGGNSGAPGPGGSVYGAVLAACGAAPEFAVEPLSAARRVVAFAASAAQGFACDPAPCLTVDVPAAGERYTLSFAGALPNPAGGRASFHFSLPQPAPVRLRIFDAGGRVVRALETGTFGAGRHVLRWDGLNEAGGRAGAGIYFARFDALDTEITRRFTLVR